MPPLKYNSWVAVYLFAMLLLLYFLAMLLLLF